MASRIPFGATVAAWLLASAIVPAQAPPQGDPAALGATVASLEPCGKGQSGAIVTVKVANRGKTFAEPLTFELTQKDGTAVVLRRVPAPYVSRAGRAAPPGGAQTYQLLFAGDPEKLTGAKCKVGDVVFYVAAPQTEPPIEVGAPRTEKRKHEKGATLEYALLPLKSSSDAVVDVTLRLVFERPFASTVLVHRRLKPKEDVLASFSDVAIEPTPALVYEGHEVNVDFIVPRGARLSSAKVVDWCSIGTGTGPEAAKLLRDAYARWLRWESGVKGVSGSFAATFWPKAGARRTAQGTFGVAADGAVSMRAEGAIEKADSEHVNEALRIAFADLMRPPVDEAVAACQATLDRMGPPVVIACGGDSWSPLFRRTRLALDGGRIVGSSWHGGSPADLHVEWRTEPFEGGYVVAERRHFNIGNRGAPTEVHRWRYARSDSGMLVPSKFTLSEDMSPVVEPWTLDLVLVDVKPDAAAAQVVPSAATETVRGAWRFGYSYPNTKIACTCKFFAKAGKDLIWRGVKDAKGKITFDALSGTNRGRTTIEIDGVNEESLERALAGTVDDRLGLWTGRDFAARGDFDRFFAGASFAEREGSPGVFDVTSGPYKTVTVKGGRIVGMTFGDGTARTLTWSKAAGEDVVTRIVTGREELTAGYERVGPLLLPVRMVYKGVFGDEKDWGTEEFQLTDFVVK